MSVWSLTMVVCKHQHGEFLQSLCELIVRPGMFSGPMGDEDQRPGERKERQMRNRQNVCIFARGDKIWAWTPDCSAEMMKQFLGETGTEKHQLMWSFWVLLTEESTSRFLENAGGANINIYTFSLTLPVLRSHISNTRKVGRQEAGGLTPSWVFSPGGGGGVRVSWARQMFIKHNWPQTRSRWRRAELRDYVCVWPFLEVRVSLLLNDSLHQSPPANGTDKIGLLFPHACDFSHGARKQDRQVRLINERCYNTAPVPADWEGTPLQGKNA